MKISSKQEQQGQFRNYSEMLAQWNFRYIEKFRYVVKLVHDYPPYKTKMNSKVSKKNLFIYFIIITSFYFIFKKKLFIYIYIKKIILSKKIILNYFYIYYFKKNCL